GVNLNFNGVFPAKADAPRIAARLAKFGFNAARIHHYEGYAAPAGIWKAAAIGASKAKIPRELDADQLDRFDFFLAELIKRGIYINLNLHVGRKAQEAEGFVTAAALPDKDKGISYYDEHLITLQQEFARTLLTHVNPYTGRAYKDEPGVCAVEVANENSLLALWLDGTLTKVPPAYLEPLRARWNAWLGAKYSDATLHEAWTETNDPLHAADLFAAPLLNDGLNLQAPDALIQGEVRTLRTLQLATTGGAAGRIMVDALNGATVDGILRAGLSANLQTAGNLPWAFQLNRDGLDLKEAQPYTLTFWARTDTPRRISVNLWQDRPPRRFLGFTGYADLTADWRQYSFVFRPVNADPQHSRLSWNLVNQTGIVQLSKIELREGGRIGVPDAWTLTQGVPLIDFKTTPSLMARRDFAEFLAIIEGEHVKRTREFLRQEIGVRCPIWHSQAQFGGWGGVWREMQSDAIDLHAYWKHPDFGANRWSPTAWKIDNVSMTTAPAIDPLTAFALFRVAGKPFVMSEWNSGQPNDFGAETLLMVAAYAAWQDWAGVFLFDYHSSGSYDRNYFEGFFSIDNHPAKMVTAPAAALLYRRPTADGVLGDVALAQDEVTLTLPRDTLWQEVANAPGGPSAAPIVKTWQTAGALRAAPLRGKTYVQFADSVFPSATRAETDSASTYTSDTGQIRWGRMPALFSVDTPRSKAVVGFLGGRSAYLRELRITQPTSHNNFASYALSSLDDAEIARSKRLLFVAAGKVENLAMGWNADRTSVGAQWGRGPTQAEGITADIEIVTGLPQAHVWALDVTGARRVEVPSRLENGVLRFSIAPQWQTLWYEISER
ncbi:MAG TPA: hypothetical protein VNA16_06270, partial [Abditibacteriaceae bacterium]|nr:hypothetical protein [Abditibacteriaceae bacterium]